MSMEYVHAAILLHKAGKQVNEDSVTQVLTAAGITADPIRVKALVATLAEVNIDEALKQATTFAPVAAAPAASAPSPGGEAKAAAPAEDKKKKEEEEKKKEEEAIEGLNPTYFASLEFLPVPEVIPLKTSWYALAVLPVR